MIIIYFLKVVENSEHAGKSVIRDLAHSFLVDVCCSRKHGITFHDASFGTAGRSVNCRMLSLPHTPLKTPLVDAGFSFSFQSW